MRMKSSIGAWLIWTSPVVITGLAILSILFGAKEIDAGTVWDAFFRFDEGNVNHQIIMHSRVPRAVGALLIGAFLAISGALMQGMTRNYLASPSIMGVTDGSAFAVTIGMLLAPNGSSIDLIWLSMVGSAVGVGMVFGLAALIPNGLSPVRMAIIGTIIGTFLSSVSEATAAYFQISQTISFWYNARVHQLDPTLIKLAIPFAIVGIALALLLAKSITIVSLGEEIARSLGQRVLLVKIAALFSVVILTGVSVALAGKIAFVGLLVPHIARFFVGTDYRKVIPCAALFGAAFLAFCDLLSRFLNAPFETPIGVVTAMFGVPFFLYLIRTRGGGSNA
ncbi:FecCD family ABC transporter permease [Paenibacillus turpanensis]|uniref:FecCD family ABC transporter permease n=1 Tax=Paenibacillus turpanensis TaxID=2689078 RepID=UPI0014076F43|nr:iron ABC transporter permease [Paenibacillus turpanensis]